MNSPISGSWLLQRFDVMQAYPVPWHHSDGRTEVSSSGCPDCPAVLQRCHKHKSVSTVPPGKFGLVHCGCHSDCFSSLFVKAAPVVPLIWIRRCILSAAKAGVSSRHQLHISEEQKLGIHCVWLQVTECPILELHFPIFNLKTIQTEFHAFPLDMAYKLPQDEHGTTA